MKRRERLIGGREEKASREISEKMLKSAFAVISIWIELITKKKERIWWKRLKESFGLSTQRMKKCTSDTDFIALFLWKWNGSDFMLNKQTFLSYFPFIPLWLFDIVVASCVLCALRGDSFMASFYIFSSTLTWKEIFMNGKLNNAFSRLRVYRHKAMVYWTRKGKPRDGKLTEIKLIRGKRKS